MGGRAWSGLMWLGTQTKWRAVVNTVAVLCVPQNAGNFLTSWQNTSFSRRTLLHGGKSFICNPKNIKKTSIHIRNKHFNIINGFLLHRRSNVELQSTALSCTKCNVELNSTGYFTTFYFVFLYELFILWLFLNFADYRSHVKLTRTRLYEVTRRPKIQAANCCDIKIMVCKSVSVAYTAVLIW